MTPEEAVAELVQGGILHSHRGARELAKVIVEGVKADETRRCADLIKGMHSGIPIIAATLRAVRLDILRTGGLEAEE